ncbi:hypothetical protein DMB38_15010 [Streptomyces sp. WAC 06738]|nr:hypothetical protein DMB38_15010 [Streptomyces sp. WAC 06738]
MLRLHEPAALGDHRVVEDVGGHEDHVHVVVRRQDRLRRLAVAQPARQVDRPAHQPPAVVADGPAVHGDP